MSAFESLVLLPWEGPEAYKLVVADYTDKFQPRDWRLLRLTRGERIFNEECMIKASQLARPGVSEDRLLDLDVLNGLQIASESKGYAAFDLRCGSRRARDHPNRCLSLPNLVA